MSQGKFLTSWKRANVIPLYKGKGDRSHPSSYRPISLCFCFEKLLEKVVVDQLTKHFSIGKPLSRIHHGFRQDCSIVANLFACDTTIANHDKGDPLDLIYFACQRTFDKVPHDYMLDSLYKLNIHPTTLGWFASFFSVRIFQVVVDGVASEPTDVSSVVIYTRIRLSPVCFCIFLYPLLQAASELTGPDNYTFPDYFKFVTSTSPREHHIAQSVVNLVNG